MKTYIIKEPDQKRTSAIEYAKELNPEQYKVVTQHSKRLLRRYTPRNDTKNAV